jgi:hypothetical protein
MRPVAVDALSALQDVVLTGCVEVGYRAWSSGIWEVEHAEAVDVVGDEGGGAFINRSWLRRGGVNPSDGPADRDGWGRYTMALDAGAA